MVDEPVKGPASYSPSIEKKYGRPIDEWQELVRQKLPAKHMELVAMLKNDNGMGHGHSNALVPTPWRPKRDKLPLQRPQLLWVTICLCGTQSGLS